MKKKAPILSALVLVATGWAMANPEPIHLFPGAGEVDVVPTASGYAAVTLVSAVNDVRFVLLDPAGTPTGPAVSLGDLGIDRIFDLEMAPAGSGYVVYASGSFTGVRSLPLDATGTASGPVRFVVPPGDVLDWEVAPGASSHLLAFGTFETTFRTFAQGVGFDGAPLGAAEPLDGFGPGTPSGLLEAVRVSPGKNGWLTAWSVLSGGVHARPVRKNGTPAGKGSTTLADRDRCGRWVAPFGSRSGSGVVYGAGCDALLPELRKLEGRGFGPAIPLDTAPYEPIRSIGAYPMDAAANANRIGVVLDTPPPTTDPADPGTWIYAEFDEDGNRLGPVLDLRSTYGVVALDVEVIHDAYRGIYVVFWVGEGPVGEGAYTLRIAPQ